MTGSPVQITPSMVAAQLGTLSQLQARARYLMGTVPPELGMTYRHALSIIETTSTGFQTLHRDDADTRGKIASGTTLRAYSSFLYEDDTLRRYYSVRPYMALGGGIASAMITAMSGEPLPKDAYRPVTLVFDRGLLLVIAVMSTPV